MSRIMFGAAREAARNGVFLHCDKKMRELAVLVSFFLFIGAHLLLGQESSRPLSPTEAYKAALAPFTATRSQANDLTDADKYALGIGIAQASRDCLALSSDISVFAGNDKELFALGQLCIFGQQFEPARAALVDYLALPKPPQREQALLLLVRAFLGLKSPGSADAQVDSLLSDYPYDAPIHGAIDQIIDNTEGDRYLSFFALKLCATQGAATLPLLAGGKVLEGKDSSVSATILFADAVRCAEIARSSSKPDNLKDLAAIVQEPNWVGTADLAPMQAALERQQMVGESVPLTSLHGYLLGVNSLVPRVLSLKRGTVLLVPFTLWSPSTPEIASDLAKFAPQQPIYAITSWHANTGREDVRSSGVLEGLRSWQRSLPKKVSILIVPDSVLSEFHSDVFPAGILMRNGTVLSNIMLSSEGAERLLVNAFAENPSAH
jgi:class 3 adenylate cyclase